MRTAKQITALDLSATGATSPWRIDNFKGASYQVTVPATGAPIGTGLLQVSNDTGSGDTANEQSPNNPTSSITNWTDVSGTSISIVSATGSPFFINVPNLYGRWMRLSYTRSSGSGTATVSAYGKGES